MPLHIVVLWEPEFPFVETCPLTQGSFQQAFEAEDTLRFVSTSELPDALADGTAVLVTPYGSAFPKAAWAVLSDFLRRGGNWVNLGGSPLSHPVRRNADGTWHTEVAQTAYGKELFINQAFPIDLEEVLEDVSIPSEGSDFEEERDPFDILTHAIQWQWGETLAYLETPLPLPSCTLSWSLQVRFTDNRDFPQEHGGSGTRDAVLRPLLTADVEGVRVAAPIVAIDRHRGRGMGGRWVLVNAQLTEPLDPVLLRALLTYATEGPTELEVRPSYACLYAGEAAGVQTRVKAHRLRGAATLELITEREGVELATQTLAVPLSENPHFARVTLEGLPPLTPGLYTVTTLLRDANGHLLATHQTGFWCYDEALLHSGKPLTVGRDYFERDGLPYPVMGTTYMAGDVHRKFLLEPNPVVWDQDFAAMKAAGVNMVRTGFWNSWRRVMLDPGAIDEGVLRAFTAFLLTARQYDIPIIFNFFAFTPEEWGGSNPYFDPHAVSAQKELVAAFAHRFKGVNDLIWDFINEPSVSSPARTWSTRPNYDPFEREAWAKWLAERAKDFSPEEQSAADPADVWRERWRLTPNAPLDLPALTDFQDQYIFQGTHPLRVLDYRLFAQEGFNQWVKALTEAIRSNGNPHQLITVGQDEGGIGERPNPHFFADVVDFTTNHTWWQNDDLLWGATMTKTPNKPNLIQETGIMFVENVDGGYRRTPHECANLLARKLVLSFAAGCAGAIQWLWNTNLYMDSDNEVGIGFHRADGTAKPELRVFRDLAHLFWENRHRMQGRKLEETVLVLPHSNWMGIRNTADAATRRAVRTLEYTLGVPTRTVSEYRIQDIGSPKLIILPSARVLTQTCWEALLAQVEAGATLVVTGPIESDEYWRLIPRITALLPDGELTITPVLADDKYEAPPQGSNRSDMPLSFRGDKIQKLEKTLFVTGRGDWGDDLMRLQYGKGHILYTGQPLELADSQEPLLHLYRIACEQAGVTVEEHEYGRYGFLMHPVRFQNETLILSAFTNNRWTISRTWGGQTYMLGNGLGIGVGFLDNATGKVLVSYPPGRGVTFEVS